MFLACFARDQVTLCSNTVKKYELALAVDVEGVGEEVKILPLNARLDTLTADSTNTLRKCAS